MIGVGVRAPTATTPSHRGAVGSAQGRFPLVSSLAEPESGGGRRRRVCRRGSRWVLSVIGAMMAGVVEVEVVVAHRERATVRVGDVFLKIDADQGRTDIEVQAMARAPVPTPEILWRAPPVLALAVVRGRPLGRLGEPSTASSAAWAAAGTAVRMLHDAPLPSWPGRRREDIASELDRECGWLVTNGVLPAGVVARNRRIAEAALRSWTPVFTHGDLQIDHVFVEGNEITGGARLVRGRPGGCPVRPGDADAGARGARG